jgi:hypothetical protein
MLASYCELPCDQGAHWDPSITLTTDAGVAIDLTGYTARLVVKRNVGDTVALADISSTGGGITITPASGLIQPVLTALQTAALPAGRLVYELELITGTTVYKVLTGSFVVRAEVTV